MKRYNFFPAIIIFFFFLIGLPLANAQYTKLLDFAGAVNGGWPQGSLVSDGTFLYGMTYGGGTSDVGVLFKIKPDGTGYVRLLDFSGANGQYPYGSLISDGTYLYGMTYQGGTNNLGVIFKIKPDGTGYSKLLDFEGAANGSGPYGSLISDGTYLYGMTDEGGTSGYGVVFKIKPDGTGYVKLLDFAGTANGASPLVGSLIFDGTFLYGMTGNGGTNDMGVIFKIKPDGTGYAKLLDFTGAANGSYPLGSLISDGTFLYGMTYQGGTNDMGVIFKIKSDGTGYSDLLDFAGTVNGSYPYGDLISVGTYLYGITNSGGTSDNGVVFKIKPDGTGYAKLLNFAGANGRYPNGSSLISDGTFLYGMTAQGGANDMGVVFKYCLLPPAIALNKTCLNYGNVMVGGTQNDSVMVTNTGCDTLKVSSMVATPAVFTVNPTSGNLPPGESGYLQVTFAPFALTSYSGTVTFYSNVNDTTVCLTGTGVPAPAINLNPDTFNVTLTGCNDSITLPLEIYNSGSENLNYTITCSSEQAPSGYCIPINTYCCPEGCGDGDYIDKFTFNTISNLNSGCNGQAGGHILYTNHTTKVMHGNTYNISMQSGSYDEGFGVWIDYNRDGDFEDAGEFVYASPTDGQILFSGTVTIPLSASSGKTRMRVRCSYNAIMDASQYCSAVYYGETEDYEITIGDIFVTSSPSSGTSLPGDTSVVNVKIKSYGLSSGMHYGILTINSNDPVNPLVYLPCSLNVVGVPDMTVSKTSINYDSMFQYASKTDSITITNSGCGYLAISNIAHVNSAYSIDSTSLTVAPWSSKKIKIIFNPQTTGSHYDTLNILNNDSNVKISLYGYALSPPVISYSPASFDVTTTNCNDSITLPLTIYNYGDTDLIFSLSSGTVGGFNFDVAIAGSEDATLLNDVRNKLLATGKFNSVTIVDVRNSTPTLATLQQYDAIIVWMDYSYNNATQLGNVLADYVDNGGGVVSAIFETGYSGHMLGRWDTQQYYVITRGTYTSGYTTLGTVFNPGHPIMKNVVSLNGNGDTYRPANTTLTATSSLIANWADGKPLVAVKEKNGSRLADLGLWPPSSDVTSDSWQSNTNGGLLMANALEWVSGYVKWLSVSSEADTIAAGDSVIINVTFNTSDLITGNYSASLIINSNDPLSPPDTIPCVLNVVGVPNMAVSKTSINYGSMFQYASKTDSIIFTNSGCGNLVISNITHANSAFGIDSTSLTVLPDTAKKIKIIFHPLTEGNFYDTLNILNNDSNIKIPLYGKALNPPVLSMNPDSFHVTINTCNDSVTVPLTISNLGDTTLNWSLGIPYGASNKALSFNGSNNYVLINNSTQFDLQNLTMEAWVYSNNFSQNGFIFEKGPVNTQYSMFFEGANFCFRTVNSGGSMSSFYVASSTLGFTNSAWHHVACTYDGVNKKIYVDGVLKSTQAYNQTLRTGQLGEIIGAYGGTGAHSYYFNGKIDEVRVWNYARTAQQISQRWNSSVNTHEAGLISYWNFNAGAGSALTDLTGHGHNGVITGATWTSGAPMQDMISVNNSSGSISAGDSTIVNVTFNSNNLVSGTYNSPLIIYSNDPLSLVDTVPCTLIFNGYPVIALSDTCLYLDSIMQYTTHRDSLYIRNNGCDTLKITDITKNTSVFSLNSTVFNIAPADSAKLIVIFSPVTVGAFYDTLSILNNDVTKKVCLSGKAFMRPIISTIPDSLDVTLACCDSSIVPLKIHNTGGSNLSVNIDDNGGYPPILFDGFESGNYSAWTTGSCGFTYTVLNTGSPKGSRNLRIQGGCSNHYQGLRQNYTTSTPAYIGFYAKAAQTNAYSGYFLAGNDPMLSNGVIGWWYFRNDGQMGLAGGAVTYMTPYVTNQWYHIEYKNINFTTHTFDYYVDGVLKYANYPFRNNLNNLSSVHLYNYNNSTSFYDHIVIGNGPPGITWLSATPETGTIVTGDSLISNVKFISCGLTIGTYTTQIVINSNDPLKPTDTIPCALHVIGAGKIAVSETCLYLDSIMQYTTHKDSLYIRNTGCDTLKVTNITKNTTVFSVNSTVFNIAPADSVKLIVTFAPVAAGTFYDTLSILNNDITKKVCLLGKAFQRPIISTIPDSLDVTLACCDSTTVPLTIYNIGGSNLNYNIKGQGLAGDTSILVIQEANEWGVDMQSFIQTQWGKTPTKINSSQIASTNFSLYDIIITTGAQSSTYYNNISANKAKFEAFVNSGGIVQYQLANYNGVTVNLVGGVNVPNGNNETYNTVLLPTHPIVSGLPITLQGNDASAGYLINLPGNANIITETQNSHKPTTVEYEYGDGLVIASSMTLGYLYTNGYNSGPMLPRITAYSMSKVQALPKWISLSSTADTVSAGDSSVVNVKFKSCGLTIGTYTTQIIINSNDPLKAKDTIPCTLDVIGAGKIAVSEPCMDLGSIMQYTGTTDTLTIRNTGCADLVVSDITHTYAAFSVNPVSMVLSTGDSSLVIVTFNPLTSGHFYDTLHIFNNDSNITVCLHGYAFKPPVISLNPDSFQVTINNCNDSVILPLTITNTGDTTLTWNISVQGIGYNKTLNFDGINDYISVTINEPETNITHEFWFKTTSPNCGLFAVVSNDLGGNGNDRHIYLSGGNIASRVWSNETITTSGINYADGNWHHVAHVVSASVGGQRLYVDGVLKASGTKTGSDFNWQDKINIGFSNDAASGYLLGQIDEVRIWNYPRTLQQITQDMNHSLHGNETGLLAYWNFNEGTGAITADLTGNGYNGSIIGATWVASTVPINNIITMDTSSGINVSGTSTTVDVTFYSEDLITGTYTGQFIINSNDPQSSVDTIPYTLIYNGYPILSLSDTCLYFDTIMQWQDTSETLVIRNTGCDILEITNITSGLPEFVPGYTTLTLAPGDSSFLTVSFNPVTVDTFISNLTLVTNIGNHNICLNGVSTYPPIISIDPAIIDTTVSACNDTVLLPVIIYNTGNHPLIYSAGNLPGITYTNGTDTVASNDSTLMFIHFNAVIYGPGTHNYSIQIASNDPLHPTTILDLGIIVNPIPSKPVAPDASICFDQPTPALSALGTAIRWYSNGELTNLLYTGNPFTPGDTAVGVYHYYATQTIDGCEGPADTATFTVFAIPLPPVSNNVTVCFGNTNTLLIAAGWNILWYDDGGLTNLVHSGNSYNTGISSVGIYPYYITQTQNGCISLSDTVTLSINPVPAPPLVHDTTVCFGNPVPVLVAGGINIQWYSDSLLMNLIIANDTLITGQTAAGIYNYYATQTDTVYSCESEPVRNTLTIFLPPRPVTSDEAVCFGFTTPDLSASGINIQWYDDGALSNLVHTGNIFPTGQTVAGTYTYYATQTDTVFGCESLSDTAVLYIYPIPPFPVASDTTICFDNITPDLAAVGNNIIWYDDTLLTNVVHSGNIYHTGITAVGTYPFFVTQTVNNCESPADTVVLTINPIPAPPLVSDTAICSGMATPDLVAIGVNINWYSDSTLTNLIYSGDTLTPADTLQGVYHYWVTQTNAGYNCEGHPAMITLTIDSLLPPPTALSQSICFGESTPDLTATGDSIRWYSDAVLTVLVHSGNIFNSGDTAVGDHIYYITQNSQCGESTADSVTLTIYPIPAAPATTDESVCFGSSVPVLTAAGANLIWYSDTAMTNVVSNDTIYDTGETAVGIYNYFITQTINGCVSPADTATLEIKPIPATPVSSDTAICFGTATPDLNATGNNVLWYSDISLTNLVNTGNTFATGETAVGVYKYYIIDYDSLVSCPSFTDSVILTINPIPAAPAASDETICFEQPTPDLVATGTNIIWYNDSLQSNIVNTGNVFTTGESAVDTFVYFATQTVSNCESPADMVVLTINPIPAPPLVSDTSICSSMTTPDLIAIGDNINWYSDSALTNLIYNGDTFSPGVSLQGIYHYWVTQTNAGYNCEGHPSMVTLTIDSLLPPPVAIGQAICFGESAPDLTATGDSIRWYSDAALTTLVHSGNIFNSGDTAVGNHVYYFTQNNHCGESTADSVTLTIYPIPATPATTDESICFGSTVPVLTATGTNLIWYSDTAMTNVVSNDTIYDTGETAVGIYNYFVTQTINGCVSPAAGISLTIHALPPLPASSDVAVCVTATIPDLVATGINITWYDSTFTTPIHLGDTLVTGQTAVGTYVYYVTQTDTITNCTSPADTVTLEIDSPLSAPLGEDKTLCLGSGLPDVTATGINMQWYDDTLLTNLVFSGDTFPTGITVPGTYYYYVTQNNACGESTADTVTLTIHDIPPTPVTSDNSVCYGNTIPSFTASGNIIRWYSDSTLTTLVSIGNDFLPPDTLPGIYTYYVADADTTTGCLSIPNSATLTIKNVPPAPLTSDTAICYGLNVTDLTASGINIHWYSDSLLVNLVDSGNTLATGQTTAGIYTYYAAQTNECGEGTASSATLTINALPSTPVVNNEAICDGAPAPVFSATGNNIIWYSDSALTINIGSGNTYTPTDTIVGYYTYYFTQTDINTGCISNAGMVTYTVNIMPLPPATTGATACSDQPASLMAIGTNITWYSDSLLTSPLDTGNIYIPADTAVGLHTYYATQSPTGCESSYETTVLTILATPSAPVVSGATICSGEIIPVLAASGSNILWYSDSLLTDSVGSGNNYTPQDSLAGTYNYYVTQTANTCESNYADALFTVHSTPLPPAILDTSVCFGTPNPVLTATGNYVIWYADSLLTTALDTGNVYTPILTTVGIYTYYLTQTDTITGCTSQSSDVLFAINTIPIPPVTLDTSICSGGINPALTATGTNIIWYSDLLLMNEVGTGASYISPQTTPGIYTYYVTQTMSNCESNYETAVLTILASPAAPVVSDTSICTGETIPAMSASGTNITWYSDSLLTDVIGTGNNYTPQDSAVGVYIYYVTQSNGICESNYSEAQFTINVSTTPPSAPDKSACFGALNPLFTATGNNITWYSDSLLTQVVHTGNTFTPDDSTAGVHHYYITQTNVTCGESTAEEVLFTIMALPAPPAANDVTICFGSTTPDLTASGINIKWYSEEELIILVNTGNTFTTGYTDVGYYTLYATQTVGGCTSPANDVILTINPTPLVTLSQYQVYIHKGESVTLTAYNANSYIWTPAAGLNTTTGPVVIATPMTTTTYTVIGTSSQGCVDTASCVIDVWQIGVEETPFAKSLLVYPNPSNGVLMIEYHTSGREILTVNLYNQINQCIFTKKLTVENGDMKEALNILNLAEGVYNLQIIKDKDIVNKKIVLRH